MSLILHKCSVLKYIKWSINAIVAHYVNHQTYCKTWFCLVAEHECTSLQSKLKREKHRCVVKYEDIYKLMEDGIEL